MAQPPYNRRAAIWAAAVILALTIALSTFRVREGFLQETPPADLDAAKVTGAISPAPNQYAPQVTGILVGLRGAYGEAVQLPPAAASFAPASAEDHRRYRITMKNADGTTVYPVLDFTYKVTVLVKSSGMASVASVSFPSSFWSHKVTFFLSNPGGGSSEISWKVERTINNAVTETVASYNTYASSSRNIYVRPGTLMDEVFAASKAGGVIAEATTTKGEKRAELTPATVQKLEAAGPIRWRAQALLRKND